MASSAGGEFKPPGASPSTSAFARDPDSARVLKPTAVDSSEPSGAPRFTPVLGADDIDRPRKRFRLLYEKRIALFAFLAALPGMAFGTSLIWAHSWSQDVKISLTVLEFFLWLVLTIALIDQIVRPLQTLTNVVGALREEDYSFRARGAAPNDAMGELALEINALADILTEQRLQSIEATALLRRVVEEIDTPLFTFDPHHVLRLVNAAGERLLQQPMARLLGKTASELELDGCFEAPNETLVALPYSAPNARWMVRKRSFRQSGVPHTMIVLSDVSRALREEERSAWQKLIRVLGHELNNSLAPIISIAAACPRACRCRNCRMRRTPTFSAASVSSSREPRRCTAFCSPTGDWRRCLRLRFSLSICVRSSNV
jgi:hypothetical protein